MSRPHPATLVLVGSLAAAGVLITLLIRGNPTPEVPVSAEPLVVHVAAGIRTPLERIAADYERETGQQIELRFGGSQTLLANLELTQQGDLFIPADESYLQLARQKDRIAEVLSLARMRAVLLLRAGSAPVERFEQLLAPTLKLAQANPDAAAIGKMTRDQLDARSLWAKLEARTTVFKGTVNDVANAVKLATVDAGIVWDAVATQYPGLQLVRLPELDAVQARVQVGVLKLSKHPEAALRFAQYCAGSAAARGHFEAAGFTLSSEDTGDPREIVLFSGSMLRPAIEDTIAEFERREGVQVTRVYNGCGILVAQMRADAKPDLYFACDQRFMEDVRDLFDPAEVISSNQLVIATPRGNPRNLRALKDLAQPNLRLGVGHEHQCALGAITRESLLTTGTYAQVRKNVVVESATGDFLINQLRTGSLDAVVAYRSNALPYATEVDAVPVTGVACASPRQPVALRKDSTKKAVSQRLIDAIRTAESRRRFEGTGFGWEGGKIENPPKK